MVNQVGRYVRGLRVGVRLVLSVLFMVLLLGGCHSFRRWYNGGAPEFVEVYFTDSDGDRLHGWVNRLGGPVYLVVVSRNAIGEAITVDTEGVDTELIYGRRYLYGQVGFRLWHDTMRFKLRVYDSTSRRHRRWKRRALAGE